MIEQSDRENWRQIVIRTDGLKWIIDPDETNSSPLEIMEICRRIVSMYNYVSKNR